METAQKNDVFYLPKIGMVKLNEKCEMRNAELNAKCGMRSAKCEARNAN